jgi:aminoglycoside phosphotransferase (APT) family kinase protein
MRPSVKPSPGSQGLESIPPTLTEPFRKSAGPFKLLRELDAIKFVQSNTTIPVPRIITSHLDVESTESAWILMERIPGLQLGEAWPNLDQVSRERTATELKGYLGQLHALRPPVAGWIGSCTGGPAYDHRIDNLATCGPFSSVAEFHDYLVAPIRKCPRPEWVAKYRQRLSDEHDTIFIHADLSRENILVDPGTGAITGIIDWEMAGFWPDWWEYRKAMIGARQRWWAELVYQIMPQYEAETEADMDIERF